MFKKLLISTILLLFITVGCLATHNIKWQLYDNGIALAQKENKKVFIYFYAEWCHYCQKMKSETFKDPAVIKYLDEHFVSIKINIDKNKELVTKFRVRGIPNSWFVVGDKKTNFPGYIPAEKFLDVLKKMG